MNVELSIQSIQFARNKSSWVVTVFWWLFLSNHLTNWTEILHALKSARSSTCHKFLKPYQAFFSHTVSKKSLVELQKFWEISRLVQILAHAKFQFNWSSGYWETVIKILLRLNWICYERTGLTVCDSRANSKIHFPKKMFGALYWEMFLKCCHTWKAW